MLIITYLWMTELGCDFPIMIDPVTMVGANGIEVDQMPVGFGCVQTATVPLDHAELKIDSLKDFLGVLPEVETLGRRWKVVCGQTTEGSACHRSPTSSKNGS